MTKTNERNAHYTRYNKAEQHSVCRVRRVLWVEYIKEGLMQVEREEVLSGCLEEGLLKAD